MSVPTLTTPFVFEAFLCRRVDLCSQLDLEISQSIELAGENLKTTSLSTAPLAHDFFRFVSGPLDRPWVKWCRARGEASRIAFTGPLGSAKASPMEPSRLVYAVCSILPCASDRRSREVSPGSPAYGGDAGHRGRNWLRRW